jgi:hypothetical protein
MNAFVTKYKPNVNLAAEYSGFDAMAQAPCRSAQNAPSMLGKIEAACSLSKSIFFVRIAFVTNHALTYFRCAATNSADQRSAPKSDKYR